MTSRTKFLKFLNPKLLRQASQFGTPPPRIFKICSLHHFLIVAAVFLAPFYVTAATFVNEHITADTTWTLAGSP